MKKLGLIAIVGCALTISSVYATWVYGQASAGSVSQSIIPQMAATGESTKKGTITVKTSGVTIVIDDAGDYKPVLQIEGQAIVEFIANKGADVDVINNGIQVVYTLSVTDDWKYDSDFDGDIDESDKTIFTINQSYATSDPVVVGKKTEENPSGQFVIPTEFFKNAISLNVDQNFALDTKAKYDSFKACLNRQSSLFTLTVSEYVAPSQS